jgi:hypothetical protein
MKHGGYRYEGDVKRTGVNWTPVRVFGTVPLEADGSAYFDVRAPERSLFLCRPLGGNAGGTNGKCRRVYKSTRDPDYQAVLALVTERVNKAWTAPCRRDLRNMTQPR